MLITFKCRDYHDVVLFGDVGETMLKAMGQSTRVPGILRSEDIPAALAALQGYLQRLREEPEAETDAGQQPDDEREDGGEEDEAASPVSLQQRAGPLQDMLEAARAGDSDIFWE